MTTHVWIQDNVEVRLIEDPSPATLQHYAPFRGSRCIHLASRPPEFHCSQPGDAALHVLTVNHEVVTVSGLCSRHRHVLTDEVHRSYPPPDHVLTDEVDA